MAARPGPEGRRGIIFKRESISKRLPRRICCPFFGESEKLLEEKG
jgi:hypothetical protein